MLYMFVYSLRLFFFCFAFTYLMFIKNNLQMIVVNRAGLQV